MTRHENDAPNYSRDEPVPGWLPSITPRWREVEEYAMKRGITIGEAVVELINKGLSHAD
jgi:hypothetical protein